jgi:hypothetical protein
MQENEFDISDLVEKQNLLEELDETLALLQIKNDNNFLVYIEALNQRLRYNKRKKSTYIEGKDTFNVVQEIRNEIDCFQEAIQIYGDTTNSNTDEKNKINKRLKKDESNYRGKELIYNVYKEANNKPTTTENDNITQYLNLLRQNIHQDNLIFGGQPTQGVKITITSLISFIRNSNSSSITIVTIIKKYILFSENGTIDAPHECLRSENFLKELIDIGYVQDN